MADTKIDRFYGLNNVSDPLTLNLGYLATADNIDITDAGKIARRAGFDLDTAGPVTGAYGTIDLQRMFYVSAGELVAMDGAVVIASSLADDLMHWAEINDRVFYANGTDYGMIEPDSTVSPWSWTPPSAPTLLAVSGDLPPGQYRVACTFVIPDGRETGAGMESEIDLIDGQALQISDITQSAGLRTRVYLAPANSEVFQLLSEDAPEALMWNSSPDWLGIELETADLDPVPAGSDVIQVWRAQMYAAQYLPETGNTAIWRSRAFGFHLFDLHSAYLAINGRVLMMAPTDSGLLIATDKAIHVYDGETLSTLAKYGAVPGCAWSIDQSAPGKPVYFWTTQGMCRFPEFANLTPHVSVAPGVHAGAAVVHADGQSRFMVNLHQGGQPFNSRS